MAGAKITDLTSLTTPADDDVLAIVDDPGGTPVTKKITYANLIAGVPTAGGLVLLEQHAASASASLDFTASISSTYDEYVIELVNLVLNTNTAGLYIRVSTDGGSSYAATGYLSVMAGWRLASTTSATVNATIGYVLIASYGTGVTRNSISGSVRLIDPESASLNKHLVGQVIAPSSDGFFYNLQLGGTYNSATAVTDFQVVVSSGNITSGTVRCYGVEK